jgi:5'-nucleotidase
VITANEGEADVINKTSKLSAYLKNEKQCNMVVCLSQLGYKNKNKVDDITLAEKSTGLDIIISGHAVNHFAHTAVVLNSNRHEVIIQPASGNAVALGNIEMGFDKDRNKYSLAINNLVAANTSIS